MNQCVIRRTILDRCIVCLLLLSACDQTRIKSTEPKVVDHSLWNESRLAVLEEQYGGVFEEELKDMNILLQEFHPIARASFPNQTDEEIFELLAIVFPEMLRYSQLKDLMETKALEVFYLREGTKAADFSIGYCQMKPSFVERLYPMADREEILHNLKNLKGQLSYLNLFRKRMIALHNLAFEPSEERVAYLATLYNLGMDSPKEEVINYQKQKNFPYGSSYEGEQYSYSDMAKVFWRNMFN